MPEALAAHRALVEVWTGLCAVIEGARFEPRSDLIVAICPGIPIPPFNGPWVVEDSPDAVAALPGAIADVEAAGEQPYLLSRQGHERTRAVARELGLTQVERLPTMVARRGELSEADLALDVSVISRDEITEAVDVLAIAFGDPREVFARISLAAQEVSGTRWYVGRRDGTIVSTALGMTVQGATGIFNVATRPEHRRRGYGGALTLRAASDGFAEGAGFAYLHSSPDGHAIYSRLGFRDVEEYLVLSRPPPPS